MNKVCPLNENACRHQPLECAMLYCFKHLKALAVRHGESLDSAAGLVKIEAIERYLRGEGSLNHLATLLGVSFTSVLQWLQTYQSLSEFLMSNYSQNQKNEYI